MVGDNLDDLERMMAGKSSMVIPILRMDGSIIWVPDDSEMAGILAMQIIRSRWPQGDFYPDGFVPRPVSMVGEKGSELTNGEIIARTALPDSPLSKAMAEIFDLLEKAGASKGEKASVLEAAMLTHFTVIQSLTVTNGNLAQLNETLKVLIDNNKAGSAGKKSPDD